MFYVLVIFAFLVSFACFAMWRYTIAKEKIENQFEPDQSQPGQLSRYDPTLEALMRIQVPDYFDEQRISQDLARLADTPGVLAKYVERARSRFTKASQRAILEHYISLYETGKRTIDSRTALERSKNTYKQLEYEHEIKRTEKEVRLEELEADREEHRTRKAKAIHERTQLDREEQSPKQTEDEKQFHRYRSKRLVDVQEKLFEQIERAAYERIKSTKLHKQLTLQIDRDTELTADDKYELRRWLDRIFEERKKDAGIFVEEEY